MRTLNLCLAAILVTFSISARAADVRPFDLSDYRKACGGRYFPACNGIVFGDNQRSMFDHASAWAKQENELVLVITGFDWCGPCVSDYVSFASPRHADAEVLKKAQADYVVVTIDRGKSGSSSVLSQLGIAEGFHELVIFDPAQNSVAQTIRNPMASAVNSMLMGAMKCEDHGQFKFVVRDYNFNGKLEFLNNPRVNIDALVRRKNADLQETCR